MKTFKILSFFIASLFLLASCDKIESDENGNYVVFSGATGTWYDSDVELPAIQRAMVEKYTGVRCTNCPAADNVIHTALDKYDDKLIAIAVHSGRFGEPLNNEADLRTEDGTAWFEYFRIVNLPAAMVNRGRSGNSWDLFTPTSGFDDRIDAIVNQDAKVSMQIISAGEENGKYNVRIYLDYKDVVSSGQTLTVLVTEDDIHTTQRGQNTEYTDYAQNHVLRQVVTDTWGMEVSSDGMPGTKRMVMLSFELREECIPQNCHLVAFVSNKETREIINAAECVLQ